MFERRAGPVLLVLVPIAVSAAIMTNLATAGPARGPHITLSTQPSTLQARSGEQVGFTLLVTNDGDGMARLAGKKAGQVPTVIWRLLDARGREQASGQQTLDNAWMEIAPRIAYKPWITVWPACQRPLPGGRYRVEVTYRSPRAPGVTRVGRATITIDLEVTTPAVPDHKLEVTLPAEVGCCSREPRVGILAYVENKGCATQKVPYLDQVTRIELTDEAGRTVKCRPPVKPAAATGSRELKYGEGYQETIGISGRCAIPAPAMGAGRVYKARLRHDDDARGLHIDQTVTLSVAIRPHS